jgi:hypothetical protein
VAKPNETTQALRDGTRAGQSSMSKAMRTFLALPIALWLALPAAAQVPPTPSGNGTVNQGTSPWVVGQGTTPWVESPGPYTYQPLGFALLTVTTTAQTLNQMLAAAAVASPPTSQLTAVPAGARIALILAESSNVRYIDDGQTPTAGYGMLLVNGQEFSYSGNLSAIRFIAANASTSALLDVSFMK